MAPKRARKQKADSPDYSEALSDDEFEAPKPKKKRAASKAKGGASKTKPKKLELFQSAPLDVLTIICSHLDAKTLLALSRTARVFRALLHDRFSKGIWAAARANTLGKLPDLTATDLAEQPWMYASLVFDRSCHGCGKKGIVCDFKIRLRGCANCMRANSLRREKITFPVNPLAWDCVPYSIFQTVKLYNVRTLRYVSVKLRKMQSVETDEGKAALKAYVVERKAIATAAIVDGDAINHWEGRAKYEKTQAEAEAARRRQQGLEAKFKELGYTQEDFQHSGFRGHMLVTQKRDLTDRIWNSVKGPLTAFLDESRVKRAQAQLKQRQRDRQEGLGPFFDKLVVSLPIEAQTTFPPIVNLLKFDGVRPLWEADDAVQDDAALNLAKPLILAEATAFARQFEIATFSKLAKAHAESTAVKDPDAPTTYSSGASHSATDMAMLASRITSSFVCPATGCSCMKPYPEILAHWREGHARFFSAAEASYWPPVATFDDWTLKTTAEHIQAIRVILSAVNKDPSLPAASEATTNVAELDAIGKRFECIECPTGPWESVLQDDEPPMLFTWSDLVQHSVKGHGARKYAYADSPCYTPPKIKIHPLPEGTLVDPPAASAAVQDAAAASTSSAVKTVSEEDVKEEVGKATAEVEQASEGDDVKMEEQ